MYVIIRITLPIRLRRKQSDTHRTSPTCNTGPRRHVNHLGEISHFLTHTVRWRLCYRDFIQSYGHSSLLKHFFPCNYTGIAEKQGKKAKICSFERHASYFKKHNVTEKKKHKFFNSEKYKKDSSCSEIRVVGCSYRKTRMVVFLNM